MQPTDNTVPGHGCSLAQCQSSNRCQCIEACLALTTTTSKGGVVDLATPLPPWDCCLPASHLPPLPSYAFHCLQCSDKQEEERLTSLLVNAK